MWRDILIIIALIFSILTYFHLTPKRISDYYNKVKGATGKRRPAQVVILALAVISTVFIAIEITNRFAELQWSTILFVIAAQIAIWFIAINSIWEFSNRKSAVMRLLIVSSFVLLFLAGIFSTDIPVWRKIVIPIVGFGGGYAIRWLEVLIRKKLKTRHISRE